MDNNTANNVLVMLSKYLPSYSMGAVKGQLLQSNIDEQQITCAIIQMKDPTIAIILSVLAGTLGVDRFYIGDVGLGVVKLLTCGGLYVWWIIDIFLIMDKTKEYNYTIFQRMISDFSSPTVVKTID